MKENRICMKVLNLLNLLISFKIFDFKSGGVAGVFGMNPKNYQNKKSLEILPIP